MEMVGTADQQFKKTEMQAVCDVKYDGARRISLNEQWRFHRETHSSAEGAHQLNFNDENWRVLDVPHDWSIELDFNPDSLATHEGGFLDGGIGWYRKTFTIPPSMKGKRISIDFDGVYMDSTTYINGELLGHYPFGYNAFSYDLTDKLYTDGRENVIAVRVNNTQPSSRWYSGSGIYRSVYLTVTDPVHVARYGTFVTTPGLEMAYAEGRADIDIKTKISNTANEPATIRVKSIIYDEDGKTVATAISAEQIVGARDVCQLEETLDIEQPKLWGLETPYRYTLVTEVHVDGKMVDTYETKFGVRFFEFDANEGFSLNGEYMKLHGVCMHHDLGALGAASYARGVKRQMEIMKAMGVNAIRVTHNPASPELLEACNQLGLLVVEESFDCWAMSKKSHDYGRFFSAWAEHDTKEMVDRGKNEPCIIMWSIGNEIYDTTSESGVAIAKNLVRWVKEIDPTRPTTIGEDKTRGDKVNVTPIDKNIEEIFRTVDIVGLNYSENNYDGYHKMNPDWKIYGAETSSATRSRGVYTHPYTYHESTKYEDLQQSSYDNDYVGWGRTAEDSWKADRDLKHLAGQFIWTGFDYIGEPTPYYTIFPSKSSYFGIVDTAGFPKDIYYYYKSQWTQEPMVHLLPHWNWSDGEVVRVLAYTNAHRVELFLNGASLGEKSYETKKTSWGSTYKETDEGKTYLEWAVPFEAGRLEAVAKDESGKIMARDEVVTAGAPTAVKLTADRVVIAADGSDLSFVTAQIVDGEGNPVPDAQHLVEFEVEGQGILAGVDNGNAASVERYKDRKRKVFNGKAIAILQSGKQSGEIKMNASVAGLSSDTIRVFTVSTEKLDVKGIAGVGSVSVTVERDATPELPSTIAVYYTDGSVETKVVAWNLHESGFSDEGVIEGTIEGTDKKARAFITVKEIIAAFPVAAAVKMGNPPVLPADVTLLYDDGMTQKACVTWEEIDTEQFSVPGTVMISGKVQGKDHKAWAHVRVTAEEPIVSTTAKLSGITVNGEAIDDFNESKAHYELVFPFGSPLPSVEATGKTNSVVTVIPAPSFPGTAKVYVISEDGNENKEYQVYVSMAEPKLISAELSLERVKMVEDEELALTISGQLENGEQVDLHDMKAIYHFEEKMFSVTGNKVYALTAGQAHLAATVSYGGVTLTTPELTIEIEKNPEEKVMTHIEPVTIITDYGTVPTMPQEVIAHYNIGIPRKVDVKWEAVDPERYGKMGEFALSGMVEGTERRARLTVIVRGAIAVETVAIAILPHRTPRLPDKVTVYYSDGTEKQAAVKWADVADEELCKEHVFTIEGTIKDVQLKATAQIRVTSEIGGSQNIARAKNGYDYPKAEASFTNSGHCSNDAIEAIHDDVISYGNNPHNRWTNWQPEPRSDDWVSITFGDYGPVEFDVDHMEIHWFEDEGTSYPQSFGIQYKHGDEWLDVCDVQSESGLPQLGQADVYAFRPVKTSALRMQMAAQRGKAIGITEIKIMSKWPAAYQAPAVVDIELNGKSILDAFTETEKGFKTTISGIETAEITAVGADNTAITILPAVTTPSTAKVIAKSEDGKKTVEYHIHLE